MVSFSDFESRLALHVKQDNSQIDNLLIVSKERDFEQTTPNIGILYTVEYDFSSGLIIRDCYLEISLVWLDSTVKVLIVSLEKRDCKFGHFHHKLKVLLRL